MIFFIAQGVAHLLPTYSSCSFLNASKYKSFLQCDWQ